MKINTILSIVAAVLCVFSVLTYRQAATRAERFERGQKFLTQLNPDNIQQIEITKDGETLNLKKDGEGFVTVNKNNYPAKNETVNRFIKDVLEISLEKEVGKGENLEKELEISPSGEATTEVVLKNDAGKPMVRFVVGKSTENGRGNYLKRLDGEDGMIYLTSQGTHLNTSTDAYLDKEILNVAATEIAQIQGADFTFETNDEGTLQLEGIPSGKKANSEAGQVKGLLSYLQFKNVYLADDPQVAGLNFDRQVEVKLKDDSRYRVFLAKKDDQHFMKIEGKFDVGQITIAQDEAEEELEKKSKVLSRADEVTEFNNLHGSWIYELTETVAKKFRHAKKDLLEDKDKDS